MRITEFLTPQGIIPALASGTKAEVLQALASKLAAVSGTIPAERLLGVLDERERLGSTGMEKGVAIPHGRMTPLASLVACFAVCRTGVDFEARDGRPSHFFFALVAPENSAGLHLKALSKISRIFRSDALREAILKAETAEEIYGLIAQEDART